MADRPGGNSDSADEPGYDWLYGTRRRGVGGSPEGTRGPAGADDPTQVQPVQPRSARGAQQRPGPRDPEPTQMLPDRPASDGGRSSAPLRRSLRDSPARPAPQRRAARAGPRAAVPSPRPRRPARPGAGAASGSGWLKYVLVLWLVFLVAVPLLAWSKIDKVDATPSGDRPSSQPGTTYLLVGSDSREGLTRKQQLAYGVGKAEGRRTDTIMLLHTGSGPNMLMSIPRDSIVPVPGHGTTKINAAFAYGGPKLLVKTIEQNTGIRVDDYVEIGFAGFIGVVDAVGRRADLPQAGDEGQARQPRHQEGLPGGARAPRRSATHARGTPPGSATSPAPSTSARWSARSARRPPRRGRSSTRCATTGSRWPARSRCGWVRTPG